MRPKIPPFNPHSMKTCHTAAELRQHLDSEHDFIAFVPTMGALHEGHMALIDAARATAGVVVASIFVNPTQFNDSSDLSAYPRTPEVDAEMLRAHGCDLLYLPEVDDVYPQGEAFSSTEHLDFGSLTARMEGANRPGHFDGVAQVVSRLLEIVQPDLLVMGQKDYQQVAVVRSMIRQLELTVDLMVVPTVREPDGLAMSSRNRRLAGADRQAAAVINQQLVAVAAAVRAGWSPRQLEGMALDAMEANPHLTPEYVEVCIGETLLPYVPGTGVQEIVVAAAVWCGPVRLIDNQVISIN